MTRINLLPPEKIKARRAPGAAGRNWVFALIILPILVAVIIGFWYFSLNKQVKDKDQALQAKKTELTSWQAKNAALQQYKTRQADIQKQEQAIVQALSGRIYWARILNEIAITMPTDVWITSLNGSASAGQGTVDFTCLALQCPNRYQATQGGNYAFYPDYRPVANWLDRMAQISEFQRIWISSAQPSRQGTSGGLTPDGKPAGQWVMGFSSQAKLNPATAAIGPVIQAPTSTPGSTPTPSTTPTTPSTPTSTGSGPGGGAK